LKKDSVKATVKQLNMTPFLSQLLPAAKQFLRHSQSVTILPPSQSLIQNLVHTPSFSPGHDFENLPPLFYLLVDGLNFCFWHPSEKKKFRYKQHSGSVALGYLIKRTLTQHPSYFTPEFLSRFAPLVYVALMEGSRGELLLPHERIRIIQEIGSLGKQHGFQIFEKFRGRDVNDIATFTAKNLPYTFNDITRVRGITLPFYKKLRLFISDLSSFGGFRFRNLDTLLIFADYRIPHLLEHTGMLRYAPSLTRRIAKHALISHRSITEAEIRGSTVLAAQFLQSATGLPYPELDFRLWLLARKNKSRMRLPHHRTQTRYY